MTTIASQISGRQRPRLPHNPQTAKPFTLRIPLALALLLSVTLVYSGGGLLLAGLASYQAQAFLDDWGAKGQEPSPHAWQIAHDAAQRAVSLYPGSNGEYLERLGRIQQWQQFRQPFGAPQANASRRAALETFRAASQARPTWPYNWAALAFAKLYLLEFDDEFAHALRQAQTLGPTRIEINRTLAEIGFLAWPRLDDGQRSATLESARRTVAHSPREAQNLLAVANRTGMDSQLCASLDAPLKDSRKICR